MSGNVNFEIMIRMLCDGDFVLFTVRSPEMTHSLQ